MRWITDQSLFEKTLMEARSCEAADTSGDLDSMEVLCFESMELQTRAFFRLIKNLLLRSNDEIGYYLTLDPDPIDYFATTFAQYPLLELGVDDSEDDYLANLNAEIGNSPANAVGTNWWKYVVMPKSRRWFVVGTRDFSNDTNGHIWCPQGWSEWVKKEYPSAVSG